MTAPDYAAMTDADLSEQAARLMGWMAWGNGWETDPGSGRMSWRPSFDFDPASDLRHAVEFGAAFLENFPHLRVKIDIDGGVCTVSIWTNFVVGGPCAAASEARARTEAIATAWNALKGAVRD